MEKIFFLTASQFVLILTRMTALFLTAPFFSGKVVPIRFRVFLALSVSALLMLHQLPMVYCFQNSPGWSDPGFWSTWLGELGLGLLMGGAALLFWGALQTAGTVIAYCGGISFPVDGGLSNDAAPITASFFYVLGIAVVFLTGGHLLLIDSLLASFHAYPPGTVSVFSELLNEIPTVFALGFQTGIQMALPVLTVILLAQIGLAILNRVLPQLDIFGLSFSVNVLVLFLVLSMTLGVSMVLFQENFERVWRELFTFR
ncbi:MAG: flagellar biosynthetic protein FliR [Thermoguttaceae bacterium]|nr:flagellar biosynthetic protein FliR [Thermoguttaceae bacterium]